MKLLSVETKERMAEKKAVMKEKIAKRLETVKLLLMQAEYEAFAFIAGGCSLSTAYGTGEAPGIIVSIIDQIITLFPAVGVVIALVGAFKLFMAFRNDQPDSYSNAVKDIVIGALLIGFEKLIWSGGANLKSKIK